MSNELSTETIFITGATSGFGEACARKFAKANARLVLIGRRQDRLAKLKKELGEMTPIYIAALDVQKHEDVFKVVADLPTEFSEISVLINNAGLALGRESAHESSLDDWENMIDTNIKGLVYCTKAILPGMVSRNWGYIVNIGSIAGNWPYSGGNVYGGTKAFVRQFSLNLKCDLLGTNVRVTNIEPGHSQTEFSVVRFKGDRTKAEDLYQGTTPLTAEDIAETIYWCITRPPHVNVTTLELMPVCQAYGGLNIKRE